MFRSMAIPTVSFTQGTAWIGVRNRLYRSCVPWDFPPVISYNLWLHAMHFGRFSIGTTSLSSHTFKWRVIFTASVMSCDRTHRGLLNMLRWWLEGVLKNHFKGTRPGGLWFCLVYSEFRAAQAKIPGIKSRIDIRTEYFFERLIRLFTWISYNSSSFRIIEQLVVLVASHNSFKSNRFPWMLLKSWMWICVW